MSYDLDDTIAAISTPIGEGGIGIVRLSGRESLAIAKKIFKPKRSGFDIEKAPSHTIYFGHAVDEQGEVIDEVLVSVFRAPQSYTTEHMVEISAHGSMVSLKQILNLAIHYGARHAEAGEFTKRAFLNGRIDLAQAEAVLDMIRAKTDRALKVAVSQLGGELSREVRTIKDILMKTYAHMEAFLDFPDEHLEVYTNQELLGRHEEAERRIAALLSSFSQGEIIREGISAVIVGKANVGKSSLLNAFLKRDRAIVSEIPGTTRDVLEEQIELEGIPVRLIDTAGFWDSKEPLSQVALQKTNEYIKRGDLFLLVSEATDPFSSGERAIRDQLNGKPVIFVVNKVDLLPEGSCEAKLSSLEKAKTCLVSAKTGEGIGSLQKKIVEVIFGERLTNESAMITRLRHKNALEGSLDALKKSHETFLKQESLEFVVLDLKRALDCLRELVGEVYSEDLLDVIFKEFCIGK